MQNSKMSNVSECHEAMYVFFLFLHTRFTFSVLFFPSEVLDLGLCFWWESGGRLLQS